MFALLMIISPYIYIYVQSAQIVRVGRKTDSMKSQISSKTSRGKKDSTKDAIKDIASDQSEFVCHIKTDNIVSVGLLFHKTKVE